MLCVFIILLILVVVLLYITVSCKSYLNDKQHFTPLSDVNVPNEKICICMYYTDNIRSYSDLTAKINKMYAEKHGYGFVSFLGRVSDRAPQWDKLIYTLIVLYDDRYDYVFWIDSDAYFNNHNKTIQDVIEIDSEHEFYICRDTLIKIGICLVNTGTYLIKRSEWSKSFIMNTWSHKIADYYANRCCHEQSSIYYQIKNNPAVSCKTKVYPTRQFNSSGWIHKCNLDWLVKNDFIIHLMGCTTEKRIKSASDWLEKNSKLVE